MRLGERLERSQRLSIVFRIPARSAAPMTLFVPISPLFVPQMRLLRYLCPKSGTTSVEGPENGGFGRVPGTFSVKDVLEAQTG